MICTQLYDYKQFIINLCSWLKSSFWHLDEIISGSTIPGKSGPGSNGNEEILHIPQSFRKATKKGKLFSVK